jgi:hypothetical protein
MLLTAVKISWLKRNKCSTADSRFLFLSLLFNSAVTIEIILTGNARRKKYTEINSSDVL